MEIFKVLSSEISNIMQFVRGDNSPRRTKMNTKEIEQLQGLLNNIGLVDKPTKRLGTSTRVETDEVQSSIRYFNSLPEEKRAAILEKADTEMQQKLMNFMEENAAFTDNIESTNSLMRQVFDSAKLMSDKKIYTEKELAVVVKDFQKLYAKCSIEAERVMQAFKDYRGNGAAGKICDGNKDEAALNLCSKYKQAISSYNQLFISNVQELLKATPSSKPDFMNNLRRTVEKFQNEVENFQNSARDIMNAFIPEVVSEENRFSHLSAEYVQKGIPADLSLQNKVIENAIIDNLLESYKKTSTEAA